MTDMITVAMRCTYRIRDQVVPRGAIPFSTVKRYDQITTVIEDHRSQRDWVTATPVLGRNTSIRARPLVIISARALS